MSKGLEGKVYYNVNNEKYIILEELNYKNILCAYAMKVLESEEEGEKKYYQIEKTGEDVRLVDVKSSKLIAALDNLRLKTKSPEKPRKIKDNESIAEYLDYLDGFYKKRIGNIV